MLEVVNLSQLDATAIRVRCPYDVMVDYSPRNCGRRMRPTAMVAHAMKFHAGRKVTTQLLGPREPLR